MLRDNSWLCSEELCLVVLRNQGQCPNHLLLFWPLEPFKAKVLYTILHGFQQFVKNGVKDLAGNSGLIMEVFYWKNWHCIEVKERHVQWKTHAFVDLSWLEGTFFFRECFLVGFSFVLNEVLFSEISPFQYCLFFSNRYGLREFVVIAPAANSDAVLSESKCNLLLSSVSIALGNTGW